MGLRIIMLVVAMATVECLDRARLQKCPPPQKAFDVDKYVGDWYMQARLPPCSWAGSSDFNNHLSQYSKQPSGIIHIKDTWRFDNFLLEFNAAFNSFGHITAYHTPEDNDHTCFIFTGNGVCASTTLSLKPEQPSGVYTLKDPIGNVISGKSVVVATDYKKFAIKWGCSKTMGDICADAYVVVKTKHREPSPHTWKMIESILDKLWGLGLSEMVRITHDKNACAQFAPARAPVVAAPRQTLFKTY